MAPLLVVTGESGSGKTTLIAGIVRALAGRGYRVGVLKHSPGHPGLETEGKDSWQFTRAGAAITCLAGDGWQFVQAAGHKPGPEGLLHYFPGMDLVLAEGYKFTREAGTPVIEIVREGQAARYSRHPLALVVTVPPREGPEAGGPWFFRDDPTGLAAFIEEKLLRKEEGPHV
jgi:molybdopterin-guanine dinucleotide biosynthesis protein MobB